MKQTMHQNSETVFSVLCGFFLSVFAFFLNIDWSLVMHEGTKIIEAFIIGIAGGAGGYFSKKWINKYFKNKKTTP